MTQALRVSAIAEDAYPNERSRGTLAEVAYANLKTAVFAFTMPPGQRYSESELAGLLRISRTPLRQALQMMQRDGLMEYLGGHFAWRVHPLNIAYYEDLYAFRIELEALAIRRIGRLQNGPDLSALKSVWMIPLPSRLTDGEAVADLDEALHHSLLELAGNQAMLRSYEDIARRIRVIRRLDFVSPERIAATYEEHNRILSELDAGNVAEAERLVVNHIENSRSEIRKITLHHVAKAVAGRGASEAITGERAER